MMQRGDLAAGFDGNAGIGRAGAPTGGWKQVEAQGYPDLFPNAAELEADWYRRTGIYPMHGTIVIKDSILQEHPWVARSLYDAFDRAKQAWLKRLHAGEATTPTDERYRALTKIVGDDPLPYGMEANLPTILKLEDTAFKQQMIPRRVPLDQAFFDPMKV
jgi:4,5-dihydroxyphthalate decarboxylase